jgi:outer membrane lipoprotein-sorting protein
MVHEIAKYDCFLRNLLTIARCFALFLGSSFARVIHTCLICVGVIFAGYAADADEVKRAEAWFNKIKSIKADFVQVASDGTSAEGKLLFRRPSQMKITYRNKEGGIGLQLITSKVWLHVDRPEEKLLTSYPLSETPLSLILAAKVSLRPDGYETRIKPSSADVVQILVAKEEGEGAGQLILEFSEKPFQFRRWVVVDAAGIQTSVTLFNLAFDTPIPNLAFRLPSYSVEN